MEPYGLSDGRLVGRLLLQVAETMGPGETAHAGTPFGMGEPALALGRVGGPASRKPGARYRQGGCSQGSRASSGPCAGCDRCGQRPVRVVLVCGPPRSGKSTYIVETFDGAAEPIPFEIVAYCNFLSSGAYPRKMPLRRREMIALAMFQEFAEDAVRRCQQFSSHAPAGDGGRSCVGGPLVVVEGPFYRRSLRALVVAGIRATLRECDVLECRWVGYPRLVGEAVRRAGYDTFKQCVGRLQVPSAEEGFDELRVLTVPGRSIPEALRLRVDALNMRDTVTEHNLLCRPDLLFDPHFRADSIWAPAE